MKIIACILIFTSSFAQAMDCEVGRMAKLEQTIEVSRTKDKIEQKHQIGPGTEVHIIAMESDRIEIYAMRDSKGVTINGYGQIPIKNLSFLKCD